MTKPVDKRKLRIGLIKQGITPQEIIQLPPSNPRFGYLVQTYDDLTSEIIRTAAGLPGRVIVTVENPSQTERVRYFNSI
jgi:hypothetical protein